MPFELAVVVLILAGLVAVNLVLARATIAMIRADRRRVQRGRPRP